MTLMDEQREALNELRVRIENCRSRTDEYGRGLLAGYEAALDLFDPSPGMKELVEALGAKERREST
jgi:hypothetical protein